MKCNLCQRVIGARENRSSATISGCKVFACSKCHTLPEWDQYIDRGGPLFDHLKNGGVISWRGKHGRRLFARVIAAKSFPWGWIVGDSGKVSLGCCRHFCWIEERQLYEWLHSLEEARLAQRRGRK